MNKATKYRQWFIRGLQILEIVAKAMNFTVLAGISEEQRKNIHQYDYEITRLTEPMEGEVVQYSPWVSFLQTLLVNLLAFVVTAMIEWYAGGIKLKPVSDGVRQIACYIVGARPEHEAAAAAPHLPDVSEITPESGPLDQLFNTFMGTGEGSSNIMNTLGSLFKAGAGAMNGMNMDGNAAPRQPSVGKQRVLVDDV